MSRKNIRGAWVWDKDCEKCEGTGVIEEGMEGFINSSMEQDCRDTYSRCECAEWDEPDPDRERDEAYDRKINNEEE